MQDGMKMGSAKERLSGERQERDAGEWGIWRRRE